MDFHTVNEEIDNLINSMNRRLSQEKLATPPRRDSDPSIAGPCKKCSHLVIGPEAGCKAQGNLWHKSCFSCATCKVELFGMGSFYEVGDNVYCQVHYKAALGHKCAQCHKAITDKIVTILDKEFHPECLQCRKCKTSLDGQPIIPDEANSLLCKPCWYELFGEQCARCKQVLAPTRGQDNIPCIKVGKQSYHPTCYSCRSCCKLFGEGQGKEGAFPFDGELYCHEHALALASQRASRLP